MKESLDIAKLNTFIKQYLFKVFTNPNQQFLNKNCHILDTDTVAVETPNNFFSRLDSRIEFETHGNIEKRFAKK